MGYKVAVLMGGTSVEREFSLASGKRVCDALTDAGHKVLPLDTTPELVKTLLAEKPDVAYIALHGKTGEDGTIQSLLEFLEIPFVGSAAAVCRSTWNKSTLSHFIDSFNDGGKQVAGYPHGVCIAATCFKDMGAVDAIGLIPKRSVRIPSGLPVCVKPASQGSAFGMHKVTDPKMLGEAILDALSFDDEVIVEEWIDGVELAVSVVGDGKDAHALPPVEIVPRHGVFDTAARLDVDAVDFFAPVRDSSLSKDSDKAAEIRSEIERAAIQVHNAYGCHDISRVDMIWDGTQAKVLEVNVSPGVTELSLLPMAVSAAGLEFPEFLSGLLDRAVQRGR